MITQEQFNFLFPGVSRSLRSSYLRLLNEAMREFKIDTRKRAAAFLAQLHHESQGLQTWSEGLNYSAKRLVEIFPKYFPNMEAALPYHRQPQKIANRTYANRMGNGSASSGDGYLFRGRCPIQATGRDMYLFLGKVLHLPLTTLPDLLLEPEHGFRAAAAIYAIEKSLNPIADRLTGRGDESDLQQFDKISRKINGGIHGKIERRQHYVKALRVLTDGQFKATITHNLDLVEQERETARTTANAPQSTVAPQTSNPVIAPLMLATAPATPTAVADEPSLQSALADVPVTVETVKTAGGFFKTRLLRRLAGPAAWIFAALEAGNIYVWLGVSIIAAAAIWYGYKHRSDIKRLAVWLIRKMTGASDE